MAVIVPNEAGAASVVPVVSHRRLATGTSLNAYAFGPGPTFSLNS